MFICFSISSAWWESCISNSNLKVNTVIGSLKTMGATLEKKKKIERNVKSGSKIILMTCQMSTIHEDSKMDVDKSTFSSGRTANLTTLYTWRPVQRLCASGNYCRTDIAQFSTEVHIERHMLSQNIAVQNPLETCFWIF